MRSIALLLLLLSLLPLLLAVSAAAAPAALSVPVLGDAAAVDASHVLFVESASEVDLGADAQADSGADLDAALEADMSADMSLDPSGHSPFRVRHVEFVDEEPAPHVAEAQLHEHSLLEHAQAHPAEHEINVPLTRAKPKPKVLAEVLLEVRARQQAQHEDFDAFIELSEGDSQDEMDEEMHEDADEDISALELRGKDVPLYQEVLKEKHLATYYGTLRIHDTLFRVLFDTGSCELWIPSQDCRTPRCMRHRRFDAAAHKPRFFGRKRMNIEYISGKVSGPMIISNVGVGGLVVPNQILGLAQTLDIELLDEVVWDGIVGMAYPSKSLVTRGVTPLFDNIIRQHLLSNPSKGLANQFAYYIDDTQGVMTFGGVNCAFVVRNSQALSDPTKEAAAIDACKSSFHFAPVTRQTYWTLALEDVTLEYPRGVLPPLNQQLKGNCGRFGCRAIVDTGTYLIYTSKFFQAPAAWAHFSHCVDTHKLPNITFHLRTSRQRTAGGPTVALTLEPRDYILKFDNSRSKEDCVVGISPDKDAVFTLGQVFLRSYYALFDRDENRIGFTRIHRQGHEAVNAKPAKLPPPLP